MKSSLGLVCMTALLLCSGCAQHYNITLSNNNVITSKGKPKYDAATSTYQFKDTNGKPGAIPAFRVKEIAPQ